MIKEYFKLLRIPHWIKNFFVFAPLFFSEHLLDVNYFIPVLISFISFSLVASIVYIYNDISDVESDRQHPTKKSRPLASGKISFTHAKITMAVLLLILFFTLPFLQYSFIAVLFSYVVLNIIYTHYLKNVVILDLICISLGFLFRVIGGALVINVYLSSWLILTTLFISIFLAVMKRRSELVVNSGYATRKVLGEYNLYFIDQISSISATCVIISYALYSVAERTVQNFQSENLVYTTLFVMFGIFRYMYLVYKKSKGENPTEIMLADFPMIINIIIYFLVVFGIVYTGTK